MSKIIIIGPGYPLRGGGITTFNHRLAKEILNSGHDCWICSFSLQYPSFFFPGKTQYSDEPAPGDIVIVPLINSINPINWIRNGKRLRRVKPDIVVVRFWIPFIGIALGN